MVVVYCRHMQVQYSSDQRSVCSHPGMGTSSQNLVPSLLKAAVWAMARAIFTPSTKTWDGRGVSTNLITANCHWPWCLLDAWSIPRGRWVYRRDYYSWATPGLVTWVWGSWGSLTRCLCRPGVCTSATACHWSREPGTWVVSECEMLESVRHSSQMRCVMSRHVTSLRCRWMQLNGKMLKVYKIPVENNLSGQRKLRMTW